MKDNNLLVMIDDDRDDHEIFSIALSELEKPIKLLSFSDCEQAISHFEKSNVDTPAFVFMDFTLPRTDGASCLLNLQKLSQFDHPCIIIYSGALPVPWISQLKAIGVEKFMKKTGSIPSLTEQLKDLLEDGVPVKEK